MRLLFVLGICLAFVFVVECFDEKEFVEDGERNDKRHLIKKVGVLSQKGISCNRYKMFENKLF